MADYYDGLDLGEVCVVEAVRRPVAAPRSIEILDMPGRAGSAFLYVRTEPKTIEVDICILALASGEERLARYEDLRRELSWRIARAEPRELVLHDAPDLMDMAVLDGSTDLDRLMFTGSTTLSFVCPDPRSWGASEQVDMDGGGTAWCECAGSAGSEPVIEVESGGGALSLSIDGAAFDVLDSVEGTVVIDAVEHETTENGAALPISILSDYPAWDRGLHTVECELPFSVRWVERWL